MLWAYARAHECMSVCVCVCQCVWCRGWETVSYLEAEYQQVISWTDSDPVSDFFLWWWLCTLSFVWTTHEKHILISFSLIWAVFFCFFCFQCMRKKKLNVNCTYFMLITQSRVCTKYFWSLVMREVIFGTSFNSHDYFLQNDFDNETCDKLYMYSL